MAKKSVHFLLTLTLAFAGALVFWSGSQEAASAAGVFRVGLNVEPTTLDPHAGLAGSDHNAFKQIFDPLVEVDESGNPIPALAVSWENPTPTEWIFHLRKGVTFHDGTPFNSAAVKFNIERLQDPATKSPIRGILMKIKAMDLIDDSTIKFTLVAPNVDFPIVMQDRPGMMVSPAAVKKFGKDFGRNPVGAGAFVFQSWKEGDTIKLKRNPNYWNKERVHLDEVELKILPDVSVAVMNLQAGNLELLLHVPPERVRLIEKSGKVDMHISPTLQLYCTYFTNLAAPPFGKKEVRQAFAYSVDAQAISKALTLGYGKAASGLLPEMHWAYEKDVARYPRDIKKAKALLERAGYPNGISATYTTIPAPPFNKIAQIAVQQASQAGFRFKLEMLEPAQAIQKAMKHEIPVLGLGWSGRASTDATFQSLVHSTGSYNNQNFVNPEVDRLIEAARSTSNVQERKKYYSKVQKIIAEELPIMVYYNAPLIVAAKKSVTGYRNYLDGKLRLVGVGMR